MNQPYIKPVFVGYLVLMTVIGFFSKNFEVKAEEPVAQRTIEVTNNVYQLEMNHANFDEIKKDVIEDDVKYIAYPETLSKDIELSEVVATDLNYLSYDEQKVLVEVVRYTESKAGKVVYDKLEKEVVVKFIDTIAPEITLTESLIELDEGESFDPEDYVESVTDNSFDEIDLEIDNPVDMDEPGEYTVTYTATDKSNNSSSITLTVIVNEVEEEVEEVVAPVVSNSPASSYTPPVYTASGDNVSQTLSLINQHRAAAGLHPLQLAGGAEMGAAALRAAEASGYVSHTRPDGRSYKTAFTDLGLYHNSVIEVLVYAGNAPADKVNWWMNSPVHRAVLMRGDITHIAIGINGKMYAGIVFSY